MINCEDTVALADDGLRAELGRHHPETWQRIGQRGAFMQERLGIALDDALLPFSDGPAYLPPFWLSAGYALRVDRGST